jgi:hypothetical protein
MREFRHDFGSFACYHEPITHGACRILTPPSRASVPFNAIAAALHVFISRVGPGESQSVHLGPMH